KDHKIRRLPVVNDANQLIGIVTRGDVRGASPSPATSLNVWELNYLLAKLHVSEFMTRNVLTVHPDTTIVDTAKLMMEKKVSGLPVVDNKNELVGIITESDLFRVMVTMLETESEPT
ncbi:MAG: CBS domain-containing protein, partial [Anaerolineales bacterium]|nr:CBS domain-containing protein [Anaerolineales bacterium]